jgi:dihydrolipoamide dehydrogenase
MVVGNVPEAVDFVVAGAGPGGYVAALRAAQVGRRVMLIENEGEAGIGGVCLTTGCIPSKALIEVAELNARISRSSMGLRVEHSEFDGRQFQKGKAKIVASLTSGVKRLLEQAGVELIAGRLALTDAQTAVISLSDGNVQFLTFEGLVLATGSSRIELDNLPFDGCSVLDSTDVLALDVLPSSLAVVGAGYIGVELGVALSKLGVRVTLIDLEERVLAQMDPLVSKTVQSRMRSLGIEFRPKTRVRGFDSGTLHIESFAGVEDRIECEKVLVAVGRRANSTNIGLEDIGIVTTSEGLVEVADDRRLAPRIAAIGDLTPGPALAHKAMAEADVAVDALCAKATAFDALVPEVVFCDPEVACVGLSVSAAQGAGLDAVASRFPLAASGRAATLDSCDGFTQIVSERGDGRLLGAQLVGPHASELIAEVTLAIEMGATAEDLSLIVHAHPTLSETLGEVALQASGRSLHFSS